MQVEVNIVSAFIESNAGGNPAGVVLNADSLSTEQKLKIAKKVGLSETAFVSNSLVADFKLDFFTPTRQIAHCGHATIATFGLLLDKGLVIDNSSTSKETIDGTRKIKLQNGMTFMEQLAPKILPIQNSLHEILESIDLRKSQLLSKPKIVNTGNSFLVLGLINEFDLINLNPNQALIKDISEKNDLIGFYVFSRQTKNNNHAAARMFAPRYGIDEESATGMAAGPLAAYLYNQLDMKQEVFNIEQGYLMSKPSPSKIEVHLETKAGNIQSLSAGGKSKLMQKMTIEV